MPGDNHDFVYSGYMDFLNSVWYNLGGAVFLAFIYYLVYSVPVLVAIYLFAPELFGYAVTALFSVVAGNAVYVYSNRFELRERRKEIREVVDEEEYSLYLVMVAVIGVLSVNVMIAVTLLLSAVSLVLEAGYTVAFSMALLYPLVEIKSMENGAPMPSLLVVAAVLRVLHSADKLRCLRHEDITAYPASPLSKQLTRQR